MVAQIVKRKIPVAFFAYNRPQHTAQALEALELCPNREEFVFYFFSDGPSGQSAKNDVDAVRHLLKEKASKFDAKIIERSTNYGLAKSIVSGVNELCDKYGWVVVIEDDLVVSPGFLTFMAASLVKYQDNPQIMQVGAYTIAPPDIEYDAFTLPITTTWGWATWKRAWNLFSWQPLGWPDTKRDSIWYSLFNVNGAGNYVSMLEDRLRGHNDSWGILWWYAVSRQRGEVIYPAKSLIVNKGFDGSGVHCGNGSAFYDVEHIERPSFNTGKKIRYPLQTKHDPNHFCLFEQALRGTELPLQKAKAKLISLQKKLIDRITSAFC